MVKYPDVIQRRPEGAAGFLEKESRNERIGKKDGKTGSKDRFCENSKSKKGAGGEV